MFQCAIHICREDKEGNEEDVLEFQESYGEEGDSYKCFYNPKNTDEVIPVCARQVIRSPGVCLLAHTFPHTLWKKIIFSICSHQADTPLYLCLGFLYLI